MIAVALVAALVFGSLTSVWLLHVRHRAGLLVTQRELLRPVELLVTLQAWIAGAGLATLATVEVYGLEADAESVRAVARTTLGALAVWLPVALGLMVPTARRLRDHDGSPFVHLNSAIAYSICLISWFGTGRWQDAF